MGKKLFRIGLVVFLLNIIFIINTSFSVSATTIDVKWGSTVNYQQQYDELFNAVAHQPYTGKGSLNSVAVSNSGFFVFVYSNGVDHYVDIYNHLGVFQREFILVQDGHVLATFDDDDNIILYLIRDNILINVGSTGEYISAAYCLNNSDLVDALSALESFVVTNSGITYEFIGKNPFSAHSQRFTVYNTNGEILFQSVPHRGRSCIDFVCILLPLLIYGTIMVLKHKQRNEVQENAHNLREDA